MSVCKISGIRWTEWAKVGPGVFWKRASAYRRGVVGWLHPHTTVSASANCGWPEHSMTRSQGRYAVSCSSRSFERVRVGRQRVQQGAAVEVIRSCVSNRKKQGLGENNRETQSGVGVKGRYCRYDAVAIDLKRQHRQRAEVCHTMSITWAWRSNARTWQSRMARLRMLQD